MTSVIGKWICCPELTIGFEEFSLAIGTPEEEWKKKVGVAYFCDVERHEDTWHVAFNYPNDAALSRSYEFKSGVETEFHVFSSGDIIKGVVDVDNNTMKMASKHIVNGEVKRKWETIASTEGDYLVVRCSGHGKEMVEKLKKM